MRRLIYTIFILLLFFCSNSYSQNHNTVDVELERIKKDIIDLQKFVYQSNTDFNNQNQTSPSFEEVNKLLLSLDKKLTSLEDQMKDMKDDISNLYQLYTSPQFDKQITIGTSKDLKIEESSSKIVLEQSNDTQILGEMTLSNLENNQLKKKTISSNEEFERKEENQILGELSIKSLEEQVVNISDPTDEQVAIIADLDKLLEQIEVELNKPVINSFEQMQIAKQSLASSDNQKAIEHLLLILDADIKDLEMLSETYYLLGRTFFIEGKIIESVKYFGIRHRDLPDIRKFRSENYFWLGKSLFSIGDQENGCLVMEDLIFSELYLNKIEIIENAKSLQKEKDCGLIIE